MVDFDSSPMMKWYEKEISLKIYHVKLPCPHICWMGNANWSNVYVWAKRYFDSNDFSILSPHSKAPGSSHFANILGTMFATVDIMTQKGLPWNDVEVILEEFHHILKDSHDGWA
jgi:hypothetical protein